jgi:flagellar protein FliO/FliZ
MTAREKLKNGCTAGFTRIFRKPAGRNAGTGTAKLTFPRKEVSIEMGSLFILVALVAMIVIAAGAYYLYTKTRGDTPLFTPKVRRLAFIERAHLDGGRKLLLVRRDDVEHLILVGGPIDLVVETGIKPKVLANGTAAEQRIAGAAHSGEEAPTAWERPHIAFQAARGESMEGPSFTLSHDTKQTAEKNGEGRPEPTLLQEIEETK